MRNKYLLSLLAALGFSGCGNNNEIWDEPCYYGPGPDWTPDIIISSQVQNEEKENINGIRVVSSYMNQEDSLITDTAYTESREIENYTVRGIAINTYKLKITIHDLKLVFSLFFFIFIYRSSADLTYFVISRNHINLY